MPRRSASSPAPVAASPTPKQAARAEVSADSRSGRMVDVFLVALFLGLTFLLGVFPLNDTDFWWHLRTGDLIRQTGRLPHRDWYTFGAADHPWIDLHWGFQVSLSALHSIGGVDATNVAKCVVTTLAVGLLITARRRAWPVSMMILAWLPALLVLSGRMYVRPETLTLLYLAGFLAVLFRIGRSPKLIWLLPVLELFWVNTQGLFVFGPILLTLALIDAAAAPGAFSPERRPWWRMVLAGSVATGVACLLNPYGIFGALYPLELFGTMNNPVFKDIQELQPLDDFIAKAGLANLPLQLHFTTLFLGGLSFLLPVFWKAAKRRSAPPEPEPTGTPKKARKKKKNKADAPPPASEWSQGVFRLLLFVLFSLLSWKATRNSHQFAAVVGTVTAWNIGEWAGAVARWRSERGKAVRPWPPRAAAFAVLVAAIAIVGSGRFYAWAKEGRTVGWGERPLWFPHAAARFAGSEGMPRRWFVFHDGHAGLFEYYNSPNQKVFADARLEVMGPEVYGRDADLGKAINGDRPGWSEQIEAMGDPTTPGLLIDHVQPRMGSTGAAVLGDPSWRCVWYDPIASVHLHSGVNPGLKPVDFAARHFGREPRFEPSGFAGLVASAKSLKNHAGGLIGLNKRRDLASAMIALGLGHARRALELDGSPAEPWRLLGQIQLLREVGSTIEPIPRFRMPFDPIFDLSAVRATYALEQAALRDPNDLLTATSLFGVYAHDRLMYEAAGPWAEILIDGPMSPMQERVLESLKPELARTRAVLAEPVSRSWNNLGELDRLVNRYLELGRAASAADVLEDAYRRPESRPWEVSDRLATLRLHLGRPDLARKAWQEAANPPRPAVRDARVAVTYLVEGDFPTARRLYRSAIAAEPALFEAHYGLAVLESDAGRAAEAAKSAEAAEKAAGTEVARASASEIRRFAEPYK